MTEHKALAVPLELKFAGGGEDVGSFEGYGAVFNNVDSYFDVIEPGAFKASLAQRAAEGRRLPPMRLMHGSGAEGMTPIGVWTEMAEDSAGLIVKGRISNMDLESGRKIYGLLRDGAFGGLSIGFTIPPLGSKPGSGAAGEPARYIQAVDLLEVSIVDDPANPLATVYAMKSMQGYVTHSVNPRELEKGLRREVGLSRSDSKGAVAFFQKHLRREGGGRMPENLRDEASEANGALKAHLQKRMAALAAALQ